VSQWRRRRQNLRFWVLVLRQQHPSGSAGCHGVFNQSTALALLSAATRPEHTHVQICAVYIERIVASGARFMRRAQQTEFAVVKPIRPPPSPPPRNPKRRLELKLDSSNGPRERARARRYFPYVPRVHASDPSGDNLIYLFRIHASLRPPAQCAPSAHSA
jgi:hypothetical protein